jgi:hypothetical protein
MRKENARASSMERVLTKDNISLIALVGGVVSADLGGTFIGAVVLFKLVESFIINLKLFVRAAAIKKLTLLNFWDYTVMRLDINTRVRAINSRH